jgi:hypothetical protein
LVTIVGARVDGPDVGELVYTIVVVDVVLSLPAKTVVDVVPFEEFVVVLTSTTADGLGVGAADGLLVGRVVGCNVAAIVGEYVGDWVGSEVEEFFVRLASTSILLDEFVDTPTEVVVIVVLFLCGVCVVVLVVFPYAVQFELFGRTGP